MKFKFLFVLAPWLSGCGTLWTVRNPKDPCSCPAQAAAPRYIYSGVRCDVESVKTCDIGGGYMAYDVPFSAIADTILLPARLIQYGIYKLKKPAYQVKMR